MMTLREEWLEKAKTLILDQVFKPHDLHFSPIIRVGCGPCPGKAIGICCNPEYSDDGAINIFISPELGNQEAMQILGCLVHELCHATCYSQGYADAGHGHPFNSIIRDVGLEGKPKSATVQEGTELWSTLEGILQSLGDYPHAPIRKKEVKKRVSEILTWVSPTDEEYTVKCKFSLTEEKGVPRDYNGEPMVAKDPDKLAELQDRTEEEIEEQEAEAKDAAAE